ncbi:MFS transporter [Pseudonocardia sp. CA-107938]|uniref:MFS transporter n=1 Tax=Pseudonocardia sp. CA-107938 TaxID=3240021 RepID=UPI003D8E028D
MAITSPPVPRARTGVAVAAVTACAALVVGFVASVNLALPMLGGSDLGPSSSALLWIVDAYVLVFACLVIPGGAAGDRFGRKGALLSGLLLLSIGALLSAGAPNIAVLLVGRVISGVGAAAVLPNTIACIVHAVPVERRAGAIAVWAAAIGAGGSIGNLGGGALLAAGGWRWLFGAVAPLALLLAVVVAVAVPVSARAPRPLRPVATSLLTLATLGLLFGIIEGPELGWGNPVVIGAFVAAALLGTAWARAELGAAQPLLDPRLFAIPRLRSAALGLAVLFFGLFALFYVNASYLQFGRGFDVLATGLSILPLALPMILGARVGPLAVARIGSTATVAIAFALVGGGLLALSRVDVSTPYVLWAAGLVVIGAGGALAMPVLSSDIAAAVPAEQAGVAGGLQSTTRELGSALGVAVIGTVLTGAFTSALPAGTPHTVAGAFAAAGVAHDTVLQAFVGAAGTGLATIGIVTLLCGALVTAQTLISGRSRAPRPTRRSRPGSAPTASPGRS